MRQAAAIVCRSCTGTRSRFSSSLQWFSSTAPLVFVFLRGGEEATIISVPRETVGGKGGPHNFFFQGWPHLLNMARSWPQPQLFPTYLSQPLLRFMRFYFRGLYFPSFHREADIYNCALFFLIWKKEKNEWRLSAKRFWLPQLDKSTA